jgi:hypothetical protein
MLLLQVFGFKPVEIFAVLAVLLVAYFLREILRNNTN